MAQQSDTSQLELFSRSEDGEQLQPARARVSIFNRIRGYEKALLLIMALVLTGIISFSLGVEKGKSGLSALAQANSPAYIGARAGASYTIQVAAYKSKELALKEFKLFQAQGLSPQAFKKGEHIVLCVGKFSNVESAQPLLIQLQRTYAGCHIIRRL